MSDPEARPGDEETSAAIDRDLSELALLGVFLGLALLALALTEGFSSERAAIFPRLTAGVIIIGVALLLLEPWLPGPLRRVVADPVDLIDREGLSQTEADAQDADTGGESESHGETAPETEATATQPTGGAYGLTPRQFTFAAITAYVVAGYLVSVLVASPLFAYWYSRQQNHPRWASGGLSLVAAGVCMGFVLLANAPLDRGVVWSVVM